MKSILLPAIVLFASYAAGDEIAEAFSSKNTNGTLIIADLDGSPIYVHNSVRAKKRFSPASTFKVVNTLIGLDTGAVESRDSEFTWNGSDTGSSAWNRDHTLESAFRSSCVWCYQVIARKVGPQRYTSVLQSTRYGNARIGNQVDQFWLDDSLRISAFEQIDFLRRLHSAELPFSKEHLSELKAIMLQDRRSGYSLYAKSGWTGPQLHIGWYVGYVETNDALWLFAMNMDMSEIEQAPLRKRFVLGALESLGLI